MLWQAIGLNTGRHRTGVDGELGSQSIADGVADGTVGLLRSCVTGRCRQGMQQSPASFRNG